MAKIIIAEDDDLVSDIVREALTKEGHVVLVVDNGADALRAIQLKKPGLVILDCTMPELSGLIVLREARVIDIIRYAASGAHGAATARG